MFLILEQGSTGTFSWHRLWRKPPRWSAKAFRTLGLTPPGSAASFRSSLSTCLFTWLLETDRREGGGREGPAIMRCGWRQQQRSSKIHDWGGRWDIWHVTGQLWIEGGWEVCLFKGRRGGCWACLWTESAEEWVHVIGSVQISIHRILLLLEACNLFHPWPQVSYLVLLDLIIQLFSVYHLLLPPWMYIFSWREALSDHWWSRVLYWGSTSVLYS